MFAAPANEIAGRTQHDQAWIDDTVESGVGGCNWQRPKPRPTEWDKPRAKSVKPAPAVQAKAGFWRRTKARLLKRVEPAAAPPAPAIVVVEPPTAQPRDPLDDLLGPKP